MENIKIHLLTNKKTFVNYDYNGLNILETIRSKSNPNEIYILDDDILTAIIIQSNGDIQKKWDANLEIEPINKLKHDRVSIVNNYVFVNNFNGIKIYRIDSSGLQLHADYTEFKTNHFKSLSSPQLERNFIFGRFSTVGILGIIYQDAGNKYDDKNGINIFEIDKSEINDPNAYPIYDLGADANNPSIYENIRARGINKDISVGTVKSDSDELESFIIRDNDGLKLYRINADSEIELLHTLTGIMGPIEDRGDNEIILFADVTGRKNSFRDVILRNKNGLYLYEYDGAGYKLINHNPMFSNERGWNDPIYLKTLKTYDTTGDGKDDLIFTGPQGLEILSYDIIENVWNTLLETNNLTVDERHARVLDVIKTDKIQLLTQNTNGEINNWTLDASPPSTLPKIEKESSDKKSPREDYPIPTHGLEALPSQQELRLRDMIDYSFMKNNVDTVTGKSKFTIPLMNSILKYLNWFSISYDGTSDTSTVLGRGWSMPEQQIVLNDQGSVFPEDHRYYLATTSNILELYYVKSESHTDARNETQTKMYFTLVGTDLIDKNSDEIISNIVYDVEPKKWTVNSNGNKYIYGTEAGTGYDVKWENWRKRGRSTDSQIQVPKIWNLVEIFDSNDQKVAVYNYDRVEVIADPKTENTFTKGMYLKSVTAPTEEGEDPDWSIEFEYRDKPDNEIEKIDIDDGNLNTFTAHTRYLTGYTVSTDEYTQTIEFYYDARNNRRDLIRISQKEEELIPVLEFKYGPTTGTLIEINSPENMKAKMTIQSFKKRKTLTQTEPVRVEQIDLQSNIYHHTDYMILTYIKQSSNEADNHKIVLKVFSPDAKTELIQASSFGMNNVNEYRVSVTDNLFYILLISRKNEKRELWVFHKKEDNKTWDPTPSSYILGERALVRGGRDFVVYTDVTLPSSDKKCYERIVLPPSGRKPDPPQHSLVLLEYKKGKLNKTVLIDSNNLKKDRMLSQAEMAQDGFTIRGKLYPAEITEELLLSSTADMFVHYADPFIVLNYRDQFGNWEHRPIADMGKQYRRTLDTFMKFDLNCERKKFLMMLYKETALQMNDNIIISYRLMLDDKSDLYTNTRIVLLGSDHRFRRREVFNQIKDHIESFSVRQNILEYTYKYDNKTEQFKIDVDMPEKKEKTQDDYDILKEVQEQMNHGFLLNIREYLATIESGKYTQNSTIIEFNGAEWEKLPDDAQTIKYPVVQKLTDMYKLEQHQPDGKIILREIGNEGRHDVNLDITNLGMIVQSLPNYIAYKSDRYGLQFQRFDIKGGISSPAETLPGETLSPHCNSNLIITFGRERNNGKDSGRSIIFRYIEPDIDTEVITTHTLYMNNGMKRKTAFQYFDEQISGSNVFFPKVFIKPGVNIEKFGYIEQITDFENKNLSYVNIRDARNQIVKHEKSSQQNQNNNEEFNKNISDTTLFDKEKEAEIVQFFPFYQSDDEVDYYGFESYESKNPAKIVFDSENLQMYQFPLTGVVFLQLSGENKFTSVYTPKNQENVYKASSWIRKPNIGFKVGTLSPNFKANIYSGQNYICTVLSKVKSRLEDWFLLEALIDMTYLKEFDTQSKSLRPNIVITNEKSSARTPISNSELRIELSISATNADEIVDVDHILFAPINLKSIVNVYNSKLWTLTAQITTTGLIKKFLYDSYNNDLAVVNEYNQVTEINAFTKLTTQVLNGNRFLETSEVTVTGKRGIYETFSEYAYKKRWEIENTEAWSLFTNIIHHIDRETSDKIHLRADFKEDSICIRFDYNLEKETSKLIINNDIVLEGDYITYDRERIRILPRGELIYILEKDRAFVFVDGLLYFDNKQTQAKGIVLELGGFTSIGKVIILEDPLVSITYTTPLDDELQKIQLIGHDRAIVRSYEIDEIGRKIKETLPQTIHMNPNQPLLRYNRNITPDHVKYRRIVYQPNSLNQIQIMDIPNSEFTEEKGTGRMFLQYDQQNIPPYILNTYPIIKGYSYQVEMKGGEVRDCNVYNNKRQKIAQYLYVPGVNGILSSYEYNEKDELQTTFTPAYHKLAETTWRSSVSPTKLETLKKNLAFHFSYTETGKPKIYQGPDSGKRLSIYNKQDLLKFFVNYQYKDENRITSVTYFNYDEINRLVSTGYINNTEKLTVEYIEKLTETYLSKDVNPNIVEYQKFEYDDLEEDPFLRENVKRVVTLTKDYPFAEEIVTNMRKHVLTRRIYLPLQNNKDLQSIEMTKQYTESGDLVDRINYPYENNGNILKIQLRYNKQNQIVGISGPDGDLCNFEYNAEGGVSKEIRSPKKSTQFERTYKYNELGGFTQISDKFLDENLTYTQPGYGNFGFGDGTMTSTTYNVKWHKSADESALKLNEQSFGKELGLENSKKCFNALKQTGYINSENYQEKIFYEPDSQIPAVCYENRNKISKAINQNTFPKYYGHSYDFGNQNELTKAKYFVGKNNVKPLQVRVLESLYKDNARDIWNKLKAFNFILEDNLQIQLKTAQAKKGSETLANPDIENDIRNAVNTLDPTFAVKYGKSIQQLLLQSYLDGKLLSIDDFKKFIDYKKNTNAINTVWNVIQSKYLNDPTNPKLRQVFDANTFQAAIRLLNEHFTTEILEDEGDTETGLLDEHGNHKTFYVGSNVRHLEYEENSNRVKTVYMSEGTKQYSYAMEHDSQGNVIKAGHKNIEHIEYDKVISKISQIRMTNGQVIKFNYDSRTDRIAKRVFEPNGKLTKEINYIRDENGKCLVQREVVYIENSTPMVTMTAYVYHPKGLLLGFYRNGEFYNVLTDHEGSTRLIEKNGEIVAAYDYYPYGSAIRVFGKDPNAHIPYRYTGQEWDEETGLYYFIARYYDPEIGRFLQMDPMGQYFSPYKFSGNSPVSLVDPDGEFVFLLVVVVFLVVGAYLGGAAVNGNWNPLEWEWSSKETWLGIIGGGIVGATIPFFAMQSVAILAAHMPLWAAWTTVAALGVGFAYAEGVKYTHNWNPFEWDYTNPSLINTIFTGFGQGTGFVYSVSGVTSPVAFFKGLSNFKKIAFVATTVGNFGLNTYIEGSAMKWNFKDPQMYIMLLTNAVHAHEGAMMFSKGVGRIGKRFTSLKTHLKSLRTGTKKIGDYLNKDVGKKLLQYTGEVLSGLEVTASKAYDTMNAVDNDEVLWNLAGSRAYSYHVQEFINDEKVARRKWQAALFFVPGSHMKKVTGFKQLPTRQLVSNLVTLFNNAKLGQTLSTGLHPIDKFYGAIDLDSSFASKLIPALGDLNNLEMVLFSNSDTGTHIVTFMDKRSSGSRLQISDVDDQEFNVNILSTIDDKLNAIRQECLRIFRDIAPQLRNDIKVTGFVNDNSLIDVLIQKIERKINANKPFVNSLNIGLKKILTTQTRRLNTKILSLRDAVRRNEANEEQKRSLQKLTKQRIEMGSLNERLNKIIDNHSPKLLGIEKILANWIPEKGIENKTIIYVETMLPVDYRQTDFIYDEGVCATSSRPIKECNWCPETISKNAHSSLNHLRWTAEIDVGSVDVNQGLFFEPTNEWKQSSSRSKRSEKSWIVSKLQTCLEYLNLTSAAHDSPIWNNRPQLEQNVPLHSDTQFTKPDYSMADVNSTLLLLDMCVRKVTGEKYIDSGNQISMIKAQEMSINITEDIEQLLLETINEELLDLIDFPYLQCRLFEAIVRGMPSKIPTIVMNSLKDVLKELTFKERQNIENYFNKKCN